MYSLGFILFLLCLPMHACDARCLGYAAEGIDNHADFLAKDVNKLKLHDKLQMRSSISKEVQTQEYGVHGIRKQENETDANNMKQTLCNLLLKAKEAVENAISSGYEIILSSGVDFHGMAKVEGLKRVRRSRSMLGNSGGDTEEDVGSKEKDMVDGDIDDVMDYSQPHRKPPIHNEKN
ncbi:hypothetical protein ES332_A12G251700v1 [Gossypium tomentosum]|uniref:Uncharacterized protein n=1 Tax=Gossypium tomentosum TaxID=34277 RepID=A0A5D2N0Z4_GOSTO|nr:hypothetical protein ES332_A12G251700v1 [Gossypium tomentosum]